MEFVGIKNLLLKCRITKRQCLTFLNPCCRWLCGCDVNLMLPGSGNLCGNTTHDILLCKHINKSVVILFRHKITTICIHTFLKDIGYLSEVGTECCKHSLLILIRCTSRLYFSLWLILIRLSSNRGIYRLGKFLLPSLGSLLSFDGIGKFLDFSLHSAVGFLILGRKVTILVLVGIHKVLCCFPHLCSLLN